MRAMIRVRWYKGRCRDYHNREGRKNVIDERTLEILIWEARGDKSKKFGNH